MEKPFNLDYRWKDIYITLLPGFYFFVLILIFCLLCGTIEDKYLKEFYEYSKGATSLIVFVLTLLWILLGVLINGIASTIERELFSIGLCLRPLTRGEKKIQEEQDDPEKTKNRRELNKEAHDNHRKNINSLPLDSRIEEYFVHYAMGRNMLYAHCIALIIFFVDACSRGCLTETIHTNMMGCFYMFIIMLFFLTTYRRYHTRYEELLKDLAEKISDEKNNEGLTSM